MVYSSSIVALLNPSLSFTLCPPVRTAGAQVMFGGKALEGHTIPAVYGAMEPTAVFVPLAQLLKPEHWSIANTELFGPFQVHSGTRVYESQGVRVPGFTSPAPPVARRAQAWQLPHCVLRVVS